MKTFTKLLLGTILCGFTLNSQARKSVQPNCKKHPLYCQILAYQPKMNKQKAMRLSNYLAYYGKQFELDPWLSLAIAMQESSLIKTKRKQTSLIPTRSCKNERCYITHVPGKTLTDVGFFQLHATTVKEYKFDADRLLFDIRYMVVTHYKVLAKKMHQCRHLGDLSWSCYHSRDEILGKRYASRVTKLYQQAQYRPKKTPKKAS